MERRKNRAKWAAIITALDASGENVERFCARRRIKRRTLQWWRWNLARDGVAPARGASSVELIAVDVVESARNADGGSLSAIELSLGDLAMRFRVGTEPGYIASLVAALRSRC